MSKTAYKRLASGPICLLLMVIVALLVCSCSVEKPDNTTASIETAMPTSGEVNNSSDFEIVCWGDSLTAGTGADRALIDNGNNTYFNASFLSYPQILQRLTGLRIYNFGVVGATSEEIAFMQGADVDMAIEDCEVYNESIVALSRGHLGNVLVIEMGSNGGWDQYQDLIDQYRLMIAHAQTDKYIIIGDTDDPGYSADSLQDEFSEGDPSRATSWELALQEAFGNHFVNMRVYMIEHGLEEAHLQETSDDVEYAKFGCISQQLRTDDTHLNSYGYYVQARAVYEKGVQLGYWS